MVIMMQVRASTHGVQTRTRSTLLTAASLLLALACGGRDDGLPDGGGTGPGDGDGSTGSGEDDGSATSDAGDDGTGDGGTGDDGGDTGTGDAGSDGGTADTGSDGPSEGDPCGEGWGGDLIPGSVDLGLASNPEILGIAHGQTDERAVFDDINAERVANGLQPLIWSDQVANVGRSHAADMNQLDYFDHGSSTRPYEGNMENWLPFPRLDFVYPGDFDRAGENIAWGYSVSEVVPAWMDSPGHRAAILDEYGWTATHGGVGIDDTMYVFNPATCAQ